SMRQVHMHDAVIVGAGGAGLWAAIELTRAKVDVAVLTKLYPTRSHTGTAQGGICAALGNLEEDHWEWHMFDTVKGGDYLTDQDSAEILAREAVTTIYELEHLGLPFNRTADGKIDQRFFGGHTRPDPTDPNPHTRTGDGVAIAYRHGVPMQDMEFFQFHPTGIYQKGILLSEAARGEGAYLRNGKGERFMEYPEYGVQTLKELAPRDMVSRA